MPRENTETAQAAYVRKQQEIARHLVALQAQLEEHRRRAEGSVHWGHVGDMAYLEQKLRELRNN